MQASQPLNDKHLQATPPDSPVTGEPESGDGGVLTPEEFQRQLRSIRPSDLLAVLREPKYALLAMAAFAGFRMNARALAQPLVLRRLAQDGLEIPEFIARANSLAAQAPPAEPEQKSTEPDQKPADQECPPEARDAAELARERERRREERERSRQKIQSAREEIAALRAEIQDLHEALTEANRKRDDLSKALETRALQAERLERRLARTKAERDALLSSASAVRKPAPAKPYSAPVIAPAESSFWAEAVARIVTRNNPRIALKIVNDVLRHSPRDVDALKVAQEAAAQQDDAEAAAQMAFALAEAALEKGLIVTAFDGVVRLLASAPDSKLLDELSRPLIAGIRDATQGELEEAAGHINHLQVIQPKAYERLTTLIRKFAPADAARALAPPKAALGLNAPLGLPELPASIASVTAKQIVGAINANETETVAAVRASLAALKAIDPRRHAEVVEAILQAGEGDESCLAPLLKQPRAPAVLDASNAAWFDQESLSDGRARLRHIVELRRVLRVRGYFPVVLIADAPLPYTIDQPDELRAMIDRNELTRVDKGVDADEVLIREALRLRGPLVTNDYMSDWDPEGNVHKIRFGIPATGNAYLLE